MARLTEEGLRRTIGVPGLFATAYGNVGSSIYYALGLVAAHALGLTPVVFMLAGVLFALTAKTYAEGAAMYPEAGGASSFARHAFDERFSFFAGWALTLDYIITIAISAFSVPHYLAPFWGALRHPPGDVIGGIAAIGVLAVLNIRGLGESARLNVVLALADLATQVLLVVVGAVLVLDPGLLIHQVHLGSAPRWSEVVFALSVAMVAYTGIETVSNMAEEARDPGRDVPRSVNLVLIAVLAVYAGISVVALSALPVHGGQTALGTTYQDDPILGIVASLHLDSSVAAVGRAYVGVLAATILFIATNAGLIGISRLSWSLAQHRQLPAMFARLHPRHRTPWFTIVVFSVLAGALLLPGQIAFLGDLYSFGAMLSFTTAHAAVVALRIRKPDVVRPYRIPYSVGWRGARLPVSALLGGAGTAAAWVSVVILHHAARYVGLVWMAAGMLGYYAYRRSIGVSPREIVLPTRRARPADFAALEYGSAVVPLFTTDVDARALVAAARLVGEHATVDVLALLHVPATSPLDARLPAEESRVLSLLEAARLAGKAAGVRVHASALRTRNPGRTIVEFAERRNAEVIYLATEHAPPGERGIGPLAAYLLRERPCRVIVETHLSGGPPGPRSAALLTP